MDWKSDENVCNFEKTIKFDRELRGDIDAKKLLINEDNLKKETKGMDIVDAGKISSCVNLLLCTTGIFGELGFVVT